MGSSEGTPGLNAGLNNVLGVSSPHPIDVALNDFLITALCGTGTAATAAAPALPMTDLGR